MHKMIKTIATMAMLWCATTVSADVWVNGQRMNAYQLAQLTQIAGEPIPAGRYWLTSDGYWGYEGNSTVQGNLYTREYYSSGSQASGGFRGYSDYDPSRGGSGITQYAPNCHIISSGGMTMDTCDM